MTKKQKTKEDVPKNLSYEDKLKLIVGEKNEVDTIETSLEETYVIPTIFTSFNRAICAGGAPVRCTYLVHGPPGGGKSVFVAGLLHSFVQAGHFAVKIDAEHSDTKKWFNDLKVNTKGILYKQPDNFEDAIDYVDEKMVNFKKMKKEGILSKDACFVFAIDTIHKLAPKDELDALRSDKKGGGAQNINKMWGMRRAQMIAAWLNKLTPIVGKENFAFIAMAHEKMIEDPNSKFIKKMVIQTKGGIELNYESMLSIRLVRGKNIYDDNKIRIGREHIGRIEKNKVGHDGENFKFFVGNGKGIVTEGFDRGLEIFEEGNSRGIIVPRASGSSYYEIEDNNKIETIHGKDNVIDLLRNNNAVYNHYYKVLQDNI